MTIRYLPDEAIPNEWLILEAWT